MEEGYSENREGKKLDIILTPGELQHLLLAVTILLSWYAHRIITQVVITGSRVLGRAISESWKQAKASSAYQKAQQSGSASGGPSFSSNGITLDEACKILNVKPPKEGKMDMEDVMSRFKKLFDTNDPKKGGSFYLQSKVLRARERLEGEARVKAEAIEREAELREGWKPKVFKDR
ncbi:hypothetical protein DSL72_004849 [Monilinia vaccinii-corymbosi]|uniref:Mitochondrial import inner membrane translocase subunit TIM16 n=1 Tax=Monilinia vaccinii-corymbosi TaxID=61207 RepID=A0A8A3PA21_9HELO|nr:hypothetical protein DSL72_004849 [Monilinia vaccinii-corymbosi]